MTMRPVATAPIDVSLALLGVLWHRLVLGYDFAVRSDGNAASQRPAPDVHGRPYTPSSDQPHPCAAPRAPISP